MAVARDDRDEASGLWVTLTAARVSEDEMKVEEWALIGRGRVEHM